jgi:hypothetical protein
MNPQEDVFLNDYYQRKQIGMENLSNWEENLNAARLFVSTAFASKTQHAFSNALMEVQQAYKQGRIKMDKETFANLTDVQEKADKPEEVEKIRLRIQESGGLIPMPILYGVKGQQQQSQYNKAVLCQDLITKIYEKQFGKHAVNHKMVQHEVRALVQNSDPNYMEKNQASLRKSTQQVVADMRTGKAQEIAKGSYVAHYAFEHTLNTTKRLIVMSKGGKELGPALEKIEAELKDMGRSPVFGEMIRQNKSLKKILKTAHNIDQETGSQKKGWKSLFTPTRKREIARKEAMYNLLLMAYEENPKAIKPARKHLREEANILSSGVFTAEAKATHLVLVEQYKALATLSIDGPLEYDLNNAMNNRKRDIAEVHAHQGAYRTQGQRTKKSSGKATQQDAEQEPQQQNNGTSVSSDVFKSRDAAPEQAPEKQKIGFRQAVSNTTQGIKMSNTMSPLSVVTLVPMSGFDSHRKFRESRAKQTQMAGAGPMSLEVRPPLGPDEQKSLKL